MESEFRELIKNIINHPNYKSMNKFIHHDQITTKYHSILVAYLAYKYVKKHNSKVDLKSLVRGALLHDYYLYDWHDKSSWHKLHGFRHPCFSYKNALIDFPDLNKIEKNIILRHMWPLTIIPPRYKESWIVQYCDKKATWIDYRFKHKQKKAEKKLLKHKQL